MQKAVYSLFVLLTVFSIIAITPLAFAAHGEGGMSATVTNAVGSSVPQDVNKQHCFIPSTVVITGRWNCHLGKY